MTLEQIRERVQAILDKVYADGSGLGWKTNDYHNLGSDVLAAHRRAKAVFEAVPCTGDPRDYLQALITALDAARDRFRSDTDEEDPERVGVGTFNGILHELEKL